MPSHHEIKRALRAKGWTQQAAADAVGCTFEHLNRVLNGHRTSASLLEKLRALPAPAPAEKEAAR
jgi:transcriptional regulator with XRE-family HTH domain